MPLAGRPGRIGLDRLQPAPKNAAERAADVAAIKSGNASAGASGVDWLGTAPEIASGDIKETVETDVLVVGAACPASWPAPRWPNWARTS